MKKGKKYYVYYIKSQQRLTILSNENDENDDYWRLMTGNYDLCRVFCIGVISGSNHKIITINNVNEFLNENDTCF